MKEPKSTRAERLRAASQKRREQEKQDVREAILQAAGDLFLQHGYEQFSLRRVAEHIGYSPGTIYLYFADKDAVLFALMEEGFAIFGRRLLEAAAASTDPRQRLMNVTRAYIDFGLQHRAYYQLMFMQRTAFWTQQTPVDAASRLVVFEMWAEAVNVAMQAGVLRLGDPVSTGDALWALLHGVVALAISMPQFDAQRAHALAATAVELVGQGLHT